jgi:hypothetical protein
MELSNECSSTSTALARDVGIKNWLLSLYALRYDFNNIRLEGLHAQRHESTDNSEDRYYVVSEMDNVVDLIANANGVGDVPHLHLLIVPDTRGFHPAPSLPLTVPARYVELAHLAGLHHTSRWNKNNTCIL